MSEPARMTPEEMDELGRATMRRLREWNPALADALDAEDADARSLTEGERAELDAFMNGTGYLVAGRRVDPATVKVLRGPTPEFDRAPGGSGCSFCAGGTCLTPIGCGRGRGRV